MVKRCPECRTPLSAYNPGTFCWAHTELKPKNPPSVYTRATSNADILETVGKFLFTPADVDRWLGGDAEQTSP